MSISHTDNSTERSRVVLLNRFVPNSIKQTDEKNLNCEDGSPMEVPVVFDSDVSVLYTYSVTFTVSFHISSGYMQLLCAHFYMMHVTFNLLSQEDNSIKWASRWDYILVSMPHTNIQWFRSE